MTAAPHPVPGLDVDLAVVAASAAADGIAVAPPTDDGPAKRDRRCKSFNGSAPRLSLLRMSPLVK